MSGWAVLKLRRAARGILPGRLPQMLAPSAARRWGMIAQGMGFESGARGFGLPRRDQFAIIRAKRSESASASLQARSRAGYFQHHCRSVINKMSAIEESKRDISVPQAPKATT